MTTKQEMQEQAKRLQEELDKLNEKIDKMPDETQYNRWKLDKSIEDRVNRYYAVNIDGTVEAFFADCADIDDYLYASGNYFKTIQEAENYKEDLLTKQKLKDLALRLNKGVELTWNDFAVKKYYIYLFDNVKLRLDVSLNVKNTGQVYCLDENFLNIAEQEIGKEKLIKLIKRGI